MLTPFDLHLYREGTHQRLFEHFGAHPHTLDGVDGVWFTVAAPGAAYVAVTGDFNGWDKRANALRQRLDPDIWEGFAAQAGPGAMYKYYVERGGAGVDLPDPFAFAGEGPPGCASIVADLDYRWRHGQNPDHGHSPEVAVSVYSGPHSDARQMGFTHAVPGAVAAFAPVRGTPQQLMSCVDALHGDGLGAALEVPAVDPAIAASVRSFWRERCRIDLLLDDDVEIDREWPVRLARYVATDPFWRRNAHDLVTAVPPVGRVLAPVWPAAVHGDEWQRLATLRTILALTFALPGRKLIPAVSEPGIGLLLGQLNQLYRSRRALYRTDSNPAGFAWLERHDAERNTIALLRCDESEGDVVFVANFSPVPRHNYRVGVPSRGAWREVLNTDAEAYGGSAHGNLGGVEAAPIPLHGRRYSITITVPPLGALFFTRDAV